MTTAIARLATALPRLTVSGLMARILEADRAYRDARNLERLSDEHLADIGFYRRFHETGRGRG